MAENGDDRLDSWKEIATFLDRNVRTVQRWERENGLPVYRVPGKSQSVYAYPQEINEWLRNSHANHSTDKPILPALVSEGRLPADPEVAVRRIWNRGRLVLLGAVSIVALVCGIAITTSHARRNVNLARIAFSGSSVVAADAAGKLLWAYDFGQSLLNAPGEDPTQRIKTLDLKNGQKEVLVAAPLCLPNRGDLSTDALYCFSATGKLMWQHRFDQEVRFAGRDYGPRWQFRASMTTSDGSSPSIWISVGEVPWWPSVLLQLDANGEPRNKFVNSGHILSLNWIRNSQGSFILAGGINNEYDAAMLAVLREDEPSGSSPQSPASPFSCDDCPPGKPYRYFLFPRSEVNRILGPAYNMVSVIRVDAGRAHAVVTEAFPDTALGKDWEIYDFSEDFEPAAVSVSDQYWDDHRRLSAEGKIKHSVENCPERTQPRIVREWSPEAGWREIRLPPIALRNKK